MSKNVYQLIAAVAAHMAQTGIGKGHKNAQQGYSFRGIDDMYNALAPVLAKEGLVILPRVLSREVTERQTQKGGTLFYVVVGCEFDFVSAHDGSKHTAMTYGEAMDSADKATNKAMSAAYKYVVMQAFCIPVEGDNDADATTHEVKPRGVDPTPRVDAAGQNSILAAIATAADLKMLKERFTIAYGLSEGDDEFRAKVIATKDARKAELDAFAPEGKRVAV